MKDKFNLVGTKIENFRLTNSRGETITIRDFEGVSNVLIILFRNKSWPYAKAYAQKISADYEKFLDKSTEILAILPDDLKAAQKFEKNFAHKYPIYFDKKKKVNKMLKQEVKPLKMGRMPATLIIDKKGIIRYAYYGDSMDDIPKNTEVIAILEKLN